MPNWCENSLTLTHVDPAQISRAVTAFKTGRMLDEFCPCPPELLEGRGWYDWRKYHWGTKWDVGHEGDMDPKIHSDGNSAKFIFDSAWSPPVEWYRRMECLEFEVTAYWYEPGLAFCGRFVNGLEERYDLRGNADWVDANIPKDINDTMSIAKNIRMREQSATSA